jgi:hypothetical protein
LNRAEQPSINLATPKINLLGQGRSWQEMPVSSAATNCKEGTMACFCGQIAEETKESTANSFFFRSLSTVSGRKAPNFLPAQERVRQRRESLDAEDSVSIIWLRKSRMFSSSQGRGTPSL